MNIQVLDDFLPPKPAMPNRRAKHNPSTSQTSFGGGHGLSKETIKKCIVDAIACDSLDEFYEELATNVLWID